jgi:hypothetical protein
MIKSVSVFFLSASSVVFVVDGSRDRVIAGAPTYCVACGGCAATKVNDANANPSITNGIQVLYLAPGVLLPTSSLTAGSGRCQLVTGNDGLATCGPVENCKFTVEYVASAPGAMGPYHNNGVPCLWSRRVAGFEVLADSISWLGTCSNTQSWGTAECYNNASSCTDGTRIVEVKYVGYCGHCVD